MEASISTFLMEMKETAYILNRANPRSLVLIDELGRGTSDTEGFTIAWAVCEFIVRTRSLAMFVVGASPWSLVSVCSSLRPTSCAARSPDALPPTDGNRDHVS